MGYIYKITNKITNKCYIGETKKSNPELRWNEHKRKIEKGIGCPALQDAVKKYGVEHFKFEILIICFDEDRYRFEKEYIKKYNSISPNGYNLTNGGEGGGFYGKKHSNETIEKIVKTTKQNYIDNPEIRDNISIKIKQLLSIDKNRDKIKNGMKQSTVFNNLKRNDKGRGFAKVKVKQYTLDNIFIKEYNSIREAGTDNNISHKNISKCINDKSKSCGGFKWKKSEE